MTSKPKNTFETLGVASDILPILAELGYEKPSPVQEQSIPVLLNGDDLLGQAQTGTGKTAAFALPILSRVDLANKAPQALVLAPTRELAIQVAESFQQYAKNMAGFYVLSIYGGQEYRRQLRALDRGVQVVVGTPGRVMDHLRRGSLQLDNLQTIVLDEADEMLKMGFIDDVEWILEQIPGEHQTALFSATMHPKIRQVAERYLNKPQHVQIKPEVKTVTAIEQSYVLIARQHKLEVLSRYLEVEDVDATLIFTRTKNMSTELSDKLMARGYTAAALNGDMNQAAREKVIARLKKGSLDIVVATDVAARGIDVERITHVVNYDIPLDTESYVHRIGRTGRAGRTGKALLLVEPRERYLLRDIERAIKQSLTAVSPPTAKEINSKRLNQFTDEVLSVLANADLDSSRELVESIVHEHEYSELDVAAALLTIYKGKRSLLLKENSDLFTPVKEYKKPGKWSKHGKSGKSGKSYESGRPSKDRGKNSRGDGERRWRGESERRRRSDSDDSGFGARKSRRGSGSGSGADRKGGEFSFKSKRVNSDNRNANKSNNSSDSRFSKRSNKKSRQSA